jgi:hypothetical protein
MTDELIKALEEIIAMQPGGQSLTQVRYIAREALAAHRSQQEAAQEPVGYMSPKQLALIVDCDDESGVYIPLRRTPKGNFTLAPFTSTAPSESEALRPLPYGSNDIQWLKAIRGALPKLLKVAEVEQQGADFVTVLGDLIARLETERAERAALSASGQKGEPT